MNFGLSKPIYIVARSNASYRVFLSQAYVPADSFSFVLITKRSQIHEASSGSIVIFLKDYGKTKLNRSFRELIANRPDLISVREWE